MFRDVMWIVFNSLVCINILDPYWRIVELNESLESRSEAEIKELKVESNKYSELMMKMEAKLIDDKLFTDANLCVDDLA